MFVFHHFQLKSQQIPKQSKITKGKIKKGKKKTNKQQEQNKTKTKMTQILKNSNNKRFGIVHYTIYRI